MSSYTKSSSEALTDQSSLVPLTRKTRLHGDESGFNFSSDDNDVPAPSPRGESLNTAFPLQRNTSPTAGVMVRDAIAYNTRLTLLLVRGTMRVQWCVHDILQPYVLSLMQWLPGAIF
ncbi:transposable element Tcb2 transposase [Trichonephila clavipes]|nr:transposable element Tcb2 transposase [Trichonephila clavipes]